ncbi:hypothetical protein SCP_1700340 [Sparassis crispa]|uniref:Protein kinase domain-containing protein n=1 Tax=Sparassis crispa TaxID=139825 RepID=A0A401H5S5_9APHY|nr:hypothetical protein SCP_1700340 [Sparassis crispa]GBE89710.1 hypothetical protein SCP_1700340 [Sparassis crispa]
MAILYFPDVYSEEEHPQLYDLHSVGDLEDDMELTIANVKLMKKGETATVYRASVDGVAYLPEGAAPPPMDIVCKDLQGIAIPRYVGLFQGEMEDGRCACLVREYCGERLRKPLCGTKWDFRGEVVNLLRQIHDKGVEHGNFSEENIVIDVEGRPFLIDFSEAEKHECEATMPITIDDIQPMLKDFGCRELFNAAVLAEVWLPGKILFMGFYVPTQFAQSPEMLATCAPEGVSPDEALKAGQEYYDMFRSTFEKRRRYEYYTW